MRSIFYILNITVIKEYYRQNAVFIFSVMLFSFGFLRAIEHITIIKMALKLPSLLALTFIVWALHACKIYLFIERMLNSKQNEFLYNLTLFTPLKRFFAVGLMQFSLMQLTILYSVWMIKIGIEEKNFGAILAIIACNLLLILAGIAIFEYRIERPNAKLASAKPIQNFLAKFQTPNYLFFVRYLFVKQPILMLTTKLFCCFILIGVCNLYPTDDYDERLLALGGLFAGIGHTVFCQQYLIFESQYLSFFRNLPLTYFQRFLSFFFAFSLLFVPEIVVLLRNLPDEVSYFFALQLIIFILSLIFLNHYLQYNNHISVDTFSKGIFGAGILFLLLIMFKIPVILMATINFSLAFFVFQKYYYKYES